VAFVKATNHDDGPPKEKHVRTLLSATEIKSFAAQDYLLGLVGESLQTESSALVMTKTVVLLHRLIREGGDMFRQRFHDNSSRLFDSLGNFKDDSSNFTVQLSRFLRSYSAFMQQRATTYSSFPGGDDAEHAQSLSSQEMVDELPFLQKSIDLGIQSGVSSEVGCMPANTLQGFAQRLILRDVLVMSFNLMKAMPRLMDLFFNDISPEFLPQARQMLVIYKEARRLIERMSNLDEQKVGSEWGALDLQVPPDAVTKLMESEIERLSKVPGGRSSTTSPPKTLHLTDGGSDS